MDIAHRAVELLPCRYALFDLDHAEADLDEPQCTPAAPDATHERLARPGEVSSVSEKGVEGVAVLGFEQPKDRAADHFFGGNAGERLQRGADVFHPAPEVGRKDDFT